MLGVYVASGGLPASEQIMSTYLQLKNSSPGRTKTERVYGALKATVQQVGGGHRLPNARQFAALAGVSTGTAHTAYRRLEEEGYLRLYKRWGALTHYMEQEHVR